MRIDLISSCTYRACLPDDPNNLAYYGSEMMAAILMDGLSKRNKDWEFHWYAPAGSSAFDDRENVTFHPLRLDFGKASEHEVLDESSIEGLSYEYITKSDFVIDHSATAANIEEARWYNDFRKYCCYRNGYVAFNSPRLALNQRHYVVPSVQNQSTFQQGGFESTVIGYGIPDFYKAGFDFDYDYWDYYDKQGYGIDPKEYFLFLHRPTKDKGIDKIIKLAKDLPKTKIVIAGNAPIAEHQESLIEAKRQKIAQGLDNLVFVDIPLNPKHHYYLRQLIDGSNAMLSPFDYPNYIEGWGVINGISVALGVPLIITDSPSTRELWVEGQDAIYIEGYYGLKNAVQHFDCHSLKPVHKFTVDDYAKKYEELASLYNIHDADIP